MEIDGEFDQYEKPYVKPSNVDIWERIKKVVWVKMSPLIGTLSSQDGNSKEDFD